MKGVVKAFVGGWSNGYGFDPRPRSRGDEQFQSTAIQTPTNHSNGCRPDMTTP